MMGCQQDETQLLGLLQALGGVGGRFPGWGHSLDGELVGAHGDAVDELHGAPEPVELHALVHMHDAIAGQGPAPDGVVQEGADAGQDDLEHGQATAQPLLGQQVALPSDGDLLRGGKVKVTITVTTLGGGRHGTNPHLVVQAPRSDSGQVLRGPGSTGQHLTGVMGEGPCV